MCILFKFRNDVRIYEMRLQKLMTFWLTRASPRKAMCKKWNGQHSNWGAKSNSKTSFWKLFFEMTCSFGSDLSVLAYLNCPFRSRCLKLTIPLRNKALWLVKRSHLTWTIQSEWINSANTVVSVPIFVKDIRSWTLFSLTLPKVHLLKINHPQSLFRVFSVFFKQTLQFLQ